jgi:hypothetical protein
MLGGLRGCGSFQTRGEFPANGADRVMLGQPVIPARNVPRGLDDRHQVFAAVRQVADV